MIRYLGDGGHAKVCREVERAAGDFLFVAIGDNRTRKRVAGESVGPYATLIHPSAVIAPGTKIGEGTVIMAGVVIQPNVVIGKHCILNTGCSVDHDCVIHDFAHIAPGARLCGEVIVGEGVLVGVGVGIAPRTEIPSWVLVKAKRLEMAAL